MNLILAVPLECRLLLWFLCGACAGSLVNLGVYRLSWRARLISPWSAPAQGAPPRHRTDRIPIFGWLGLRRESALHGPGFWIRPMLVELLLGLGAALLYWWEVDAQGLLPASPMLLFLPSPHDLLADLHAQYASHMLLILLMLTASLIDADEKTIPDAITITGTLVGLLVAAAYPWSLLPVVNCLSGGLETRGFLTLAAPHDWPSWLTGFPERGSLWLALGCWWLWCIALMPRIWRARHGWRRAVQLLFARLVREVDTWWMLLLGLAGSAAIAGVWWAGGPSWTGLLTALVGMAAGAGLIWAVRIIGAATLGREAMGFGDVTLMAMVGAFLGWQTCLLVFFLAPLLAIGVGVLRFILRREREIPYGPFLCLAALLAIVFWNALWLWAESQVFVLGMWVPKILVVCLAAMAILLAGYERIRRAIAARWASSEDGSS